MIDIIHFSIKILLLVVIFSVIVSLFPTDDINNY